MHAPALAYADYEWDPRGRGFRQKDLTVTQVYDRAYLAERYAGIPDKVNALIDRRLEVLEAFVEWPRGGRRPRLIDFGCGLNGFAALASESGFDAQGYDLIPGDGPRTNDKGVCLHPWDVATFFDSLEHVPEPDDVVRWLDARWVMVSVPWCHLPDDPAWFLAWKHRRPGEHLWHWGPASLANFFWSLGYREVMRSSFEDDVRGRLNCLPNILTAIFRRD